MGATPEQKLAVAQDQYSKAFDAWNNFKADLDDVQGSEQKQLQLKLEMEKALAAQKEAQQAVDEKAATTQKEITAEQQKRVELGETDKQKLNDATAERKKNEDALAQAKASGTASNQDLLNLQLKLEESITAEKQAQVKVEQQAKAYAEQKAKLLQDQKEAQQAVAAAQLDASLFHGEVSSLARTGLGGRVSGPNYGNQAQLKAAQEAAKHLAEINTKLSNLGKNIGVASS